MSRFTGSQSVTALGKLTDSLVGSLGQENNPIPTPATEKGQSVFVLLNPHLIAEERKACEATHVSSKLGELGHQADGVCAGAALGQIRPAHEPDSSGNPLASLLPPMEESALLGRVLTATRGTRDACKHPHSFPGALGSASI